MTSFNGFFNNAALMLILCVLYDTFAIHAIPDRRLRVFITGSLVGLIAVIVMLNPWSLQPGVFFDTRWVLLSLCGLFFELEAALIAICIAGLFRLYQGGAGEIVGTVVIIVTTTVGICWKYGRRQKEGLPSWKELYLFGLVVQVAMLSCMSFMPAQMRIAILKNITLPIITIFPILTMFIGLILKKQQVRRETEQELIINREALSRERGLLRGILSAVPDHIFFKDTQGAYLGCNRSFETYAERPEKDLVGKVDFDLFDHDLAESITQMDQEMLACGQLKKTEELITYPDGRKLLFDTVRVPFCDERGAVHGLVGIARDITDRKLIEDQLAAERERLAVTLRSIGDGVITTDVDGRVQMVNSAAEAIIGWNQKEASGKEIRDVYQIDTFRGEKAGENPVQKAITDGCITGNVGYPTLLARDGTEKRIAENAAPIRDEQDTITGAVLVFRDVTEQLRTEMELQKIKKLESVGVLAGGIAHDFNNILAAILGDINLVLSDSFLTNESRELLGDAEKATLRASNLAKQLLTFSKGGDPVKDVVSLKKVIKESTDFILHGSQVACTYNFPEDLWLLDIDRGQIGQVIQNIVLNSMEAMVDGGRLTVTCENCMQPAFVSTKANSELQDNSRFVKITVTDQGPGIPKATLEKIFDPYFTTKEEGSGLGLALSHSIVEKHGGAISVESGTGGTSMIVILPASARQQKTTVVESKAEDGQYLARILLMDDDDMVRGMLLKMLTRLGHSVEETSDGAEAIARYQNSFENEVRFDLVLMDLTIPGGIGGKEAVKEILRIDPNARVIVSSGYSNSPIMANYRDFGFCGAIEKPYRTHELSSVIQQVCGAKEAKREKKQ